MTKAKNAKGASDAQKGEAKPGKSAAKPKAEAKAEKPEKSVKKAPEKAKPAKSIPAKEKEKAPPAKTTKKSHDTERIEKPMPTVEEQPKPVAGFTNSGLGIKVSSKKPALSVAPGVMILGRSNQAQPQQAPRPSERRLSKKEQADIKNFLLERRERLLAGMRRELAMQKERAESKAADEVDKATDAYDEDLSFEIATANDQELEEIQIALEKIERGTYGECEVCGCAISPSRLKVLPSATTCVSCRGQEEQSRRRDDGNPTFAMMMNEDGEGDADPM